MTPLFHITRLAHNENASIAARKSVMLLTETLQGSPLSMPQTDGRGRPIALNGLHWSIAHKNEYIAAAVAKKPIGIDIETLIPRHPALFDFFSSDEWAVLGERSWRNFYMLWTAKEALSKKMGIGMDALPHMKLAAKGAWRMTLTYASKDHQICIFPNYNYLCAYTL